MMTARPRSRLPLLVLGFVAGVPALATACKRPGPVTVVADASSPPAEAGVDGAGPTSVEECRSLYDRAQILAEEAWQRARKDCRADEDCVLASRSGCITDCGAFPIATASLPEWKKAHDELESTTCKRFWDGDCLVKVPVATPTCEAYRAVCVHGQCVAK